MSIISGFVSAACVYAVMKYRQKFIIEPKFAEFGRMSTLLWKYDWNFGKTSYGCTKVWKDGESTTYTLSGDWMYELLKKDRPSQEKIIKEL